MKKDRVVSEVLGEEITITPSDLYSKEFRTKLMGGYDKDEVEHFLERVADVFESLVKQNRELRTRNDELRQEVEGYHEMESTLRNALVTSQKFHENVLDNARREADAMLEEAKLAKALAITKASKLPELLQNEINTLRAQRDQLRTELHAFLHSHRDMLENLPQAEDVELALARENAAHEAASKPEAEEALEEAEAPPTDGASDAVEKQETAAEAEIPPAPEMKPARKGSTAALTRMLTRPMQLPDEAEAAASDHEVGATQHAPEDAGVDAETASELQAQQDDPAQQDDEDDEVKQTQ